MIKTIIEKNLLAMLGAYLVLFIATGSALAEGQKPSYLPDNDTKASSSNYSTTTVNLAASEVDIISTTPNNTSSSYGGDANIDKENIQQSVDNKVRCLYFPSFMGIEKDINVEKDLICRNSIELMAMAAYQTGNLYQGHGRFGYSHLWDRFRLDTKGSFQDVRKSDIHSQAADGSVKLALIADIYPYFLIGGHWRSNQRDFYYYSVGPGFKITEALILEGSATKQNTPKASSFCFIRWSNWLPRANNKKSSSVFRTRFSPLICLIVFWSTLVRVLSMLKLRN